MYCLFQTVPTKLVIYLYIYFIAGYEHLVVIAFCHSHQWQHQITKIDFIFLPILTRHQVASANKVSVRSVPDINLTSVLPNVKFQIRGMQQTLSVGGCRLPWRITWSYRGNRQAGGMAIYVNLSHSRGWSAHVNTHLKKGPVAMVTEN